MYLRNSVCSTLTSIAKHCSIGECDSRAHLPHQDRPPQSPSCPRLLPSRRGRTASRAGAAPCPPPLRRSPPPRPRRAASPPPAAPSKSARNSTGGGGGGQAGQGPIQQAILGCKQYFFHHKTVVGHSFHSVRCKDLHASHVRTNVTFPLIHCVRACLREHQLAVRLPRPTEAATHADPPCRDLRTPESSARACPDPAL